MFSLDSPFMRFINRLGELVILNILYVLTCIPIVTIGAASTALYDVCFRLGTPREGGLAKSYFEAFRRNFKLSTVLWLMILVIGIDLVLLACLTFGKKGFYRVAAFIILLVILDFAAAASYIFPIISQFGSEMKQIVKNAFVMSLSHVLSSLCIVVLNFLPLAVLLLFPTTFARNGGIMATLYFSVTAYINSRLLNKVFEPYRPDEEDAAEDSDI